MATLEILIKILKGIGWPIVWLGKQLLSFFKKIKGIKLPKIKWRKFNFGKFKFPKLRFLKIRLPKIKINKIWFWLILILLILGIGGFWFYEKVIKNLPDVNLIYNPPNMSTVVTDRNGIILYKFYQDENRTWVSLQKIPQDLIEATIAIEDKNFYHHHGISFKGIVNAIRYNFIKDGEETPRGGSTIMYF